VLSVLGFLIILGPLVVFHELGHYIFARIFNVKAEIFSIGFGPRLWSRQIGETNWRVSAIPLGGYVKLLGDSPDHPLSPEDLARSLPQQAAYKRLLIFFGGPLFNFILAALIFAVILVVGEPQAASVIGRVVHGSHAESSGLMSGDRVVQINQSPVTKFEEILNAINEHPKQALTLEVERRGLPKPIQVQVTPKEQMGFSVYGETTAVGEVEGLLPMARAATVGISDPNSLAAKNGLKTGDTIVSLQSAAITSWEEFERDLTQIAPGTPIQLGLKRDQTQLSLSYVQPASRSLTEATGLHSSELFVEKPIPDSPALRAGVLPGDRLVRVGEHPIQSFFDLRDAVQRGGEKAGQVTLTWERDGKLQTADLKTTATNSRDPLLKKSTQYTIGVVPMLNWVAPATVTERVLNPFVLVYRATERMVVFTYRNFVSIGKMFTGDVSLATLGGPITIGKVAGESLSRGLITFLTTMAILSVGLGVLNLLPVPVLDGGHIVLLLLEVIRGKALSIRQLEIIQQVGLSLILLLMLVVMRNDLSRLSWFN
jgi:regulator of sigma E protease